jgi:hypothetical protein
MDLLRGLWALVKSVSDSQSGDEVAGRLQALCAEIRAELGSAS